MRHQIKCSVEYLTFLKHAQWHYVTIPIGNIKNSVYFGEQIAVRTSQCFSRFAVIGP